MSSPRTETTSRPDDDAEQPRRTQLSAVQIFGGALVAVCSAVVASFFGVAGTLIGAALASVISTVSATLYSESLKRTNERLRAVRQQLGRPPGSARTTQQPATRALPAELDPRRAPSPRRRPRWTRVAAYAAAVFALAMGIVTGVELIGQQPVSALVGGSTSSGTTTLGSLTNAFSSRDSTPTPPATPPPAPSTAPTPQPTDDAEEEGEAPVSTSEAPTSTSTRPTTSSPEPTRSSTPAPQRTAEQPATPTS